MYKYQSDAWQMANLNAFVSILELKLNYVHIYIYIHAGEERKLNLKFDNFIEKLISKRNYDLLKFIESWWKLFFPSFT